MDDQTITTILIAVGVPAGLATIFKAGSVVIERIDVMEWFRARREKEERATEAKRSDEARELDRAQARFEQAEQAAIVRLEQAELARAADVAKSELRIRELEDRIEVLNGNIAAQAADIAQGQINQTQLMASIDATRKERDDALALLAAEKESKARILLLITEIFERRHAETKTKKD